MMRVVFLGAPGVGKGTQAEQVSSKFGYPKISTGDILREAVRNKTELGLQAKAFMDQGQLVPDSVVIGLVKEKLQEPSTAKGFLLDGFPRTTAQAEELDKTLKQKGQQLDRVVNVNVSRDEVVRELTGRRSCSRSAKRYFILSLPLRLAKESAIDAAPCWFSETTIERKRSKPVWLSMTNKRRR